MFFSIFILQKYYKNSERKTEKRINSFIAKTMFLCVKKSTLFDKCMFYQVVHQSRFYFFYVCLMNNLTGKK